LNRLHRIAPLIAQAMAIAALVGCGGGDTEVQAASGSSDPAPAPVPSPAPSPSPGPSPAPPPVPSSYSVALSWASPVLNTDGTSLTDVSGYQISYGSDSANLSKQLVVAGRNVNGATITGLAAGTYYLSIRTVNSAGVLSPPSAVVSQTVP
jgi:hypothetical protein